MLTPSFNDSKAGGRVDWPCNEPTAMWILRSCDLRGLWMLWELWIQRLHSYIICINCIRHSEIQRASAWKNSNMQDSDLLEIICKAFASYVFGHHRVERRLTNRTKPLNIGDKLMMRFRIFQATLSPYHPTSAFWHPHLQSLVQPVDSICHALCQWWQGTCHLATGQSGYACKHPVLRPCLQITCYCDF